MFKNRKQKQKKQRKQTAMNVHPMPTIVRSLEDICQMFQRGELGMTVRNDHIFGGRFDGSELPLSFYTTLHAHEAELIDLIAHNDLRVCIGPTSETHINSVRMDENARLYCHACQTIRELSELMHVKNEAKHRR